MSILKALQRKAEESNKSFDDSALDFDAPPMFKERPDFLTLPRQSRRIEDRKDYVTLESPLKKRLRVKTVDLGDRRNDPVLNALSKLNSNIYLNLIKQPSHHLSNKLLNNRFRVISLFSDTGGICETFLAQDIAKSEITFCIIKKLRPVNDQKQFEYIRHKFNLEAQSLHVLGNICDQIPEFYDFFEQEKELYLAQELIQGSNLHQLVLQNSPLNEETVKLILTNLLRVLEIVHAHQIIHRDIKPENIIFREFDKKPVLIDFGFVKDVFRSEITEDDFRSHIIVSEGYTALEQSNGNAVFASDIYSLGATVIYLLTGKPPKSFPLNAFNRLAWEDYAPNISKEFSQIINKAIEPNLTYRFQTATDMLDALIDSTDSENIDLIEESTLVDKITKIQEKENKLNGLLKITLFSLSRGFLLGLCLNILLLTHHLLFSSQSHKEFFYISFSVFVSSMLFYFIYVFSYGYYEKIVKSQNS